MKIIGVAFVCSLLGFAVGCGGSSMGTPPASISLALSSSSVTAFQGQAAATDNVTVSRVGTSENITVTLSGLPTGATIQIQSPGSGNSGSLSIDSGTSTAGTYPLTVTASDGAVSSSATLTLIIGVAAQISNTETGPFNLAMSTSFQPAEWDYTFFSNFPAAKTPLNNLGSQHIRLQPVSQGVPQKADESWDFSILDAVLNPVIGTNDDSPELQLATAPAWMDNSSGHILPAHFSDFASYAADVVLYYNTTTGFTDSGGTSHVHSNPPTPVTYWGIFNEPNINGLDVSQYTQLYNVTVPAMQAADPDIKFVAVELSDGYNNWEQMYMPIFVNGVTAQVDVLATHFYSSCNQKDTDQQVMATVPGFASGVTYIYSQLATKPPLANVPVWITENNVNADFEGSGGMSTCNPGQPFVTDARGSSVFFAAWRPLMFSQVGKAGAQALYQWVFAGDAQYGELDDSTGDPRLSYWVDDSLEHLFPTTAGAKLLQFSSTDNADIEILPVRNADNSVVVMVADYAVANATDNNGPGLPRTVAVDVSALGAFTGGSLLLIDSNTNVTTGPTPTTVAVTSPVQIAFDGYGVAFLKLQP
jgi:Glycosyl hydrolase catalytic core